MQIPWSVHKHIVKYFISEELDKVQANYLFIRLLYCRTNFTSQDNICSSINCSDFQDLLNKRVEQFTYEEIFETFIRYFV